MNHNPDAVLAAVALIRANCKDDTEGAEVFLGSKDLRAITAALTAIATDMLVRLTMAYHLLEDDEVRDQVRTADTAELITQPEMLAVLEKNLAAIQARLTGLG